MKLVDTCVWAEVLRATPTGRALKPLIPPQGQLLVSTMVVYELSKWLARNVDSEVSDQVMVALLNAEVVEPTSTIALQAAQLSVIHKLHALDALIYATASNTTPSWSPATRTSKTCRKSTTRPK